MAAKWANADPSLPVRTRLQSVITCRNRDTFFFSLSLSTFRNSQLTSLALVFSFSPTRSNLMGAKEPLEAFAETPLDANAGKEERKTRNKQIWMH